MTDYLSSKREYTDAPKFRCVARATVFPDERREGIRRKYMPDMADRKFDRFWRTKVGVRSASEQEAIRRNFNYLFDSKVPPFSPGRFNTESYPALYTAKSSETAKAERLHYAEAQKPFEYVVYTLTVSTKPVVDLRPFEEREELVIEAAHTDCRKIADSLHTRCSGIAWYSVRDPGGACCAFFSSAGVQPGEIVEERSTS